MHLNVDALQMLKLKWDLVIARWRIDNHVPLKQLARAAGVNLSSLSHAICGGREVKMNLLLNLANAMGEDPRDIVKPKALASQETK